MLFNSPQYLIFLPVAFLAYFVVGQRHRWLVLLFVSLIFYAFLQAPYLLGALGGVTVVSYVAGRRMAHAGGSHRRRIMQAAVAANLLLLFLMRYLPLLTARAWPAGRHLVTIGVSYYVFQAISYVVDIYMEVEPPEPHFGHFALYLAFFPKLLQGPIERAGSLLPQLKSLEVPSLDRFRSGIMLIVGGLFKKMVIADRLGLVVDPVFLNVRAYSGPIYLLAIYGYALQIYFDFSGYTDIALGTARLFNIELTPNFNAPYMARNIAEFWRRWHISFSRWILDYIFKPLQIQWRDGGKWGSAAALLVTFLLSGLWHGATWGFLIWGGLHGLYLGVSLFYKSRQKKLHATLGLAGSPALAAWQVFFTFNLVSLAWLFFRANALSDAFHILAHLFERPTGWPALASAIEGAAESGSLVQEMAVLVVSIGILAGFGKVGAKRFAQVFFHWTPWLRFAFYYVVVMFLVFFGYFTKQAFAYVRF